MKFRILILILLFSGVVSGHLEAGEDKVIDGYLIDFGYDPGAPKKGDKVILAFNLVDDETKETLDFDSVWVRISLEDAIVFSGTFHPEDKHVGLSYVFFKEGKYEIVSRFKKDGEILTVSDFDLEVGRKFDRSSVRYWGVSFIVLALVLVAYYRPVWLGIH
jgi:hypothetical protein